MNMNRGLLFWALALITAGATALAVQQGYVEREVVGGAWRLWPVILIAIGLSIILARTPFAVIGTILAAVILGVAAGAFVSVGPGVACGGDIPDEMETGSGEFTGTTASVNVSFNCGELAVAMADGSGWSAATAIAGSRQVDLTATGEALDMTSSEEDGWRLDGGRQRWELGLGTNVTYDLDVDMNGADAELDLSGGTFSRLEVDPNAVSLSFDLSGSAVEDFSMAMNAGSAQIQTDAGTALAGTIAMNAGSLELCIAPDAAVRISVGDNVALSHNLEGSDLAQSGDTWTSESFDSSGDEAVDLRIEGNAASFTLNPGGGCS